MKIISRKQEAFLTRFLLEADPHSNVLLVEGARQVGKTTLIEKVLQTKKLPVVSCNLEKHRVLRQQIDRCVEFNDFAALLLDRMGFNPLKKGILFIDEAQESLVLGGFVRFMKEEWPGARVILSGSTLTRLFRPEQRFPVGRVTRLLVTGFDFSEYLRANGKERLAAAVATPAEIPESRHESLLEDLDRYLETGGLPAVVNAAADHRDWRGQRQSIIADYIEDFRRIFGEPLLTVAQSCLHAVAHLVGNAFKNSTVIPSASNRENREINEILSRMEDWKMVISARQHGPAPEQARAFHPKRYLFDTGILREFREQAVPSLRLLEKDDPAVRTALGGVIENQLAIELSRYNAPLSGWKKSSAGTEIDFVVKSPDRVLPVECKAALRIKGTHLKGVLDYMDHYKLKTGYLVSLAPYQTIDCGHGRKVVNLPLYSADAIQSVVTSNGEENGK